MSREPHLFNWSGVSASSADIARIEATARDYLDGWIDGDANRLAGSLHPEARKRAAVDHQSDELGLVELDIRPWLERVRGRGPIHISRDCDVRVLDVFRNIATVLVLSEPFMDYLHLARFGGRWLIVNVLYQER